MKNCSYFSGCSDLKRLKTNGILHRLNIEKCEEEIQHLKDKLHRRNMQIKELKRQQCVYIKECEKQGKEDMNYLLNR